MGKAQSKRSVDITTEVKKDDVPEEGTGKMGKIEDVDQLKPQVNGDTNHSESDVGDKEKSADTEGTENEKDLSTEKEQQAAEPKANLEGGDETKGEAATTPTGEKPVENGNGNDDTLNESKNAAETNENGDSSKKPKKEKVKKKWSLRSISFGKKDKQKPPKKEETTTNGECEKVPEEGTEEPTKNGDATPEENAVANASSDEKSPATSPATESKDVTTPAAEAIPAAESTPVVNGSSEPAKEDKPIAEVAPTVVAEEKVPEKIEVVAPIAPVTTAPEEPPKVDAVPEPVVAAPVTESAPVVSAEPAKTEEVPVPAKIEVNAENVQDETNEIKSDAASTVSDVQQQGDIDKEDIKVDEDLINKNIGGDSESAQNLPPPPLPCTSPPSQVSVFALSDDSNKETPGSEQLSVPSADLEDTKPEQLPSPNLENESASEAPTSLPATESEKDEVQPTEENSVILSEPDLPAISARDETSEEQIIDNSSSVEATINESMIEKQNLESQDESNKAVTLLEKTPVDSEQIAETIALIDEVTKEAAITVTSQLKEIENTQSTEKTTELAPPEQQTSPQNQSVEPAIVLPTDSLLPEEQKSTAPEETSISESSSLVVEDVNSPQEDSSVAQSLPNVFGDKTETILAPTELIGDHGSPIQTDVADTTSIPTKEEGNSNVTPEKDSVSIVDDPVEKVSVDVTTLPTILPSANATESEDVNQVAKLKENGFGENHSAETSATESLNGHNDHKTIEEMKSECSEKLASEPTTELAAGAIEVKE